MKHTPLQLNKSWTVTYANNELLLHAGADATYSIEQVDSSSFFATMPKSVFYRKDIPEKDVAILEQLLSAGIVLPRMKNSKKITIAVLGDINILAKQLQSVAIEKADLVVILRTTSSFSKLLSTIDYPSLHKPHIFLDLAYHHTISIGPLVFFGETACIACLEGRIGARWGEVALPPKPAAATRYQQLAIELLKTELHRLEQQDFSLTNVTVEWDLEGRNVTKNKLFKVPFCPVCSQTTIEFNKPLVLP